MLILITREPFKRNIRWGFFSYKLHCSHPFWWDVSVTGLKGIESTFHHMVTESSESQIFSIICKKDIRNLKKKTLQEVGSVSLVRPLPLRRGYGVSSFICWEWSRLSPPLVEPFIIGSKQVIKILRLSRPVSFGVKVLSGFFGRGRLTKSGFWQHARQPSSVTW